MMVGNPLSQKMKHFKQSLEQIKQVTSQNVPRRFIKIVYDSSVPSNTFISASDLAVPRKSSVESRDRKTSV